MPLLNEKRNTVHLFKVARSAHQKRSISDVLLLIWAHIFISGGKAYTYSVVAALACLPWSIPGRGCSQCHTAGL